MIRTTFASPFVITLAACASATTPLSSTPTSAGSDAPATSAGSAAPHPLVELVPAGSVDRTWRYFRDVDGCDATLVSATDCSPNDAKRWCKTRVSIPCDDLDVGEEITVDQSETGCSVRPKPKFVKTCPKGMFCNPPTPRDVKCPQI